MADSDVTSSANAQNELKKRARRRLVGAATLALTAAIVLPMVMDHEPRPPVSEIQIHIPTQDGTPFTARPGEVPPSPDEPLSAAGKAEGVRRNGSEAPATRPAETAAVKPAEAPAAVGAPVRGADKAADVARTNDKPPEKTARAIEAPPPPARPERPAANAEEARAAALLSGGGASSSSGEWVIQLGAYRDPAKVRNLVGKLKEMGVPTYTEKIEAQHGPMTRVRAGPFASHEAAEKALKRVRIVGVDGPIAQR